MTKYSEVGERIKQLRGEISQEEFAKKLSISLSGYQNYEAGKRIPHPHTLTKMAEMCDTTVDWILTGEFNVEKARMLERAKASFYLEEIVEKLEQTIKREEKLLYTVGKEHAPEYGLPRLEEKEFIEKLRGYITDIKIDFLPVEKRKLLEAVIEILDSGNEKAVEVLKANIVAFLDMVRISKNHDENKSN